MLKGKQALVSDQESFTRQIEVPANSKILEIHHRGGNVSIIGWEKPYILIEGTVQATAESVPMARAIVEQIEVVAYERPTNRLVLDYEGPPNVTKSTRETEGIDYIANVPRALVLDLDVKHGSLNVSNLQSDVWIDHRLGDVKVESVEGDLQIRTESGKKQPGIVIARSIERNLSLDTKYVKVDIEKVAGDLDILHKHGELTISDVKGAANIECQYAEIHLNRMQGFLKINNFRGDVVCQDFSDGIIAGIDQGTLKLQPNAPIIRAYDCEVEYGNIILRVPENASMLAEIRAENGSIHSDFNLPIAAESNVSYAKGAVNEGRPMVRLRVKRGGVNLLKASTVSWPAAQPDDPVLEQPVESPMESAESELDPVDL